MKVARKSKRLDKNDLFGVEQKKIVKFGPLGTKL